MEGRFCFKGLSVGNPAHANLLCEEKGSRAKVQQTLSNAPLFMEWGRLSDHLS